MITFHKIAMTLFFQWSLSDICLGKKCTLIKAYAVKYFAEGCLVHLFFDGWSSHPIRCNSCVLSFFNRDHDLPLSLNFTTFSNFNYTVAVMCFIIEIHFHIKVKVCGKWYMLRSTQCKWQVFLKNPQRKFLFSELTWQFLVIITCRVTRLQMLIKLSKMVKISPMNSV